MFSNFVIFSLSLFTFLYAIFILLVRRTWNVTYEVTDLFDDISREIEILVSIKNEEDRIISTLNSLRIQVQNTGARVTIIDDNSSDDSWNVVSKWIETFHAYEFKIIRNKNFSGKKGCIYTGIKATDRKIIITTDADCEFSEGWLNAMSQKIFQERAFVTGPIKINAGNNFLEAFQAMDTWIFMALTQFGHRYKLFDLANGANLGYLLSDFRDVDGYSGNEHILSGDDIFLATRMRERNKNIEFIKDKNAIVTTESAKTWKKFLHQRARWAGKSKHYPFGMLTLFPGFIWIYQVFLIMILLVSLFRMDLWYWALIFWGIKLLVDGLLLLDMSRWMGQHSIFRVYGLIGLLFYPFYFLTIGFLTLIGFKSTWK
jgi:poly-beta-1,6-N-acetyl-D-glucosamine synthase